MPNHHSLGPPIGIALPASPHVASLPARELPPQPVALEAHVPARDRGVVAGFDPDHVALGVAVDFLLQAARGLHALAGAEKVRLLHYPVVAPGFAHDPARLIALEAHRALGVAGRFELPERRVRKLLFAAVRILHARDVAVDVVVHQLAAAVRLGHRHRAPQRVALVLPASPIEARFRLQAPTRVVGEPGDFAGLVGDCRELVFGRILVTKLQPPSSAAPSLWCATYEKRMLRLPSS